MAYRRWPDDLPCPLRENLVETLRDGRLSPQTETGPGMSRRRSSIAKKPLQFRLTLTFAQRERLEYFYEYELDRVRPFLMTDTTRNNLSILTGAGLPILTDAGAPLIRKVERRLVFIEPPSIAAYASKWQAQLSLGQI